MTAPNRLRDRPLQRGRGRVYMLNGAWHGDYRALNGTIYGAWDESPDVVYAWIDWKSDRTKAVTTLVEIAQATR